MYVHMSVGTHVGQERALNPLELALQAAVSLLWVLGTILVLCKSSVCSLLKHL